MALIFKKFEGLNVSGMVAADKNGIIKIYRSSAVVNKAADKENSCGSRCKVVVNGVHTKLSHPKYGQPKSFAIVLS